MNLILIRHPETIANRERLIYGKTDYAYTDVGIWQFDQVKKMVLNRKIDRILSSPLGRARKLAEAIGKELLLDVHFDKRLEEMNYGDLEGMRIEEAESSYPEVITQFKKGDIDINFPKGESIQEFNSRTKEVFDEIVVDSNRTLLVITHGGVIRTAIEYLLQADEGFSWYFSIENGCFIELEIKKQYVQIKNLINMV